MLNPFKDVLTLEMVRYLIAKIKGALATKVSMGDVVSSWQSTPDDAHVPTEKLVKDTLDNLPPGTAVKGDAESEYRTGDVNLTPANIGAATASQGANADTAVQGVKVNGTELSKDSNNKVDVPVPTASPATPLKDGTESAGSSSQWARGDHRHPTDDSREAVANKVQSIDDTSTTEYPSSKAVADFVNSSVSTNTATFLGNFSLDDLGLTYPAAEVQIASALNSHTWPIGYPTNNDYVYVEIRNPQSTIDDKVQRYKYRDGLASWGYEYTLNNSSFTAEEKAAIDSGITLQDVTNLRADHTTLEDHVDDTNNPHSVTKDQVGLSNVDNTSDANKPVSTAQQTALNNKQDTISDLATIRSGASAGASALQPSGNGSNLSVTPDGTSTEYDLGSSTTLKAFAQKFKNLVGALKALAFKDKVSDSDISGTISDSHIASASTWDNKTNSVALTNASYGYTLLFTVAISNSNSYKGTATFRVHTSVDMLKPIILYGRIGANNSGFATMYYSAGINENRFKLCYKVVGNSTEVWLVDAVSSGPSERRTAIEFIEIQGLITVGNNSSQTDPTGLTDFAVAYLKNIHIDTASVNSGSFGTDRIADDAITAAKVKDNETLPVNVSGSAGSASVLSVKRILTSSDNIDELENDEDFTYYHWLQNSIPSGTLPENITTYGYLLCEGHSNRKRQVMCIAGDTQKIYTRQCYARQGDSLIWTPWHALATVPAGGAGSTSIPVYVDTDGQLKKCQPSSMSVGWASNVNLSKTVNAVSGDSIKAGTGASVTIGNAGNAKKWDSWKIAVDSFGTSADTIYFY